jgi:predicted  nucleic acid-binding Zn-ribbon protein
MEKALDARARLRQKKTMTAAEMDSFCSMYDDIIKAFELQRKEKYEAEDSLLSLAMVMEKTRQKYVDLSSEVQGLRHNNTVLENELKTISTKYRLARDSLYEETKAKELLQKEIKDMEARVSKFVTRLECVMELALRRQYRLERDP